MAAALWVELSQVTPVGSGAAVGEGSAVGLGLGLATATGLGTGLGVGLAAGVPPGTQAVRRRTAASRPGSTLGFKARCLYVI